MMKAVQFSEYGDPHVLEFVEVEEPHAGPGQVRIAVSAAGINGIDWKLRAGELRDFMPLSLPSGTGIDAAGIVDELGDGVDDVALGDAVFGSGSATLAEHAVLTDWALLPEGLSFEEAAGYGVAVETAIRILDQIGVRPGQTLLVSGASGGVGSAVVQIARERKINVIGTASEKNLSYVVALGAVAVPYGPDLVARIRAVAPAGIDAALDIAGSGVVPDLIELTGDATKVLSIADFSAPGYGALVSTDPVNRADAFREVARLFSAGAFHLPVAQRYALTQAADAHRDSATGHVAGRRVVTVSEE